MPSKKGPEPSVNTPQGAKRKDPPQSSSNSQHAQHRGRDPKRVKLVDARTILSQKADAALNNGELDLHAFLKSREFEIKALQDGMERSKSSRTTRAFQQVPRDLRRRTASHNVKRVPKRLHKRAAREMREDNTPTVDASKRKPGSSRGRIRAETAKRLGILAAKKKKAQNNKAGIETRPPRPKIRRDKLNDPPKPKSKFRKRQIHKTWLPTHMWHAKRAKMTEPKSPLWRFAIPITSTEKSYRPTHRAGGVRGCVAWDMSYISTIALEGPEASLEKVLIAMGVSERGLWEKKGERWRQGKRSWNGWFSREVNKKLVHICPCTILWSPPESIMSSNDVEDQPKGLPNRRIFVRIHPSAFLETWEELIRLSKLQRPAVHIEDLRFEIGSVEINGPGSTETLLGLLHPFTSRDGVIEPHAEAFKSLAGVTNPASLPLDSVLSFSIFDPRLRYPPRPAPLPRSGNEEASFKLLETLSSWPVDLMDGSSALFDRDARYKAIKLPSQKALNRRKSLAPPGQYARVCEKDPAIPIMLLTTRPAPGTSAQGTWTLLGPWKCILPIWHGIAHYPLSSGGNPRFGGLDELRQIHFGHGIPWFPADYPGTAAGFSWEQEQRLINKTKWDRKPKGKRIEWDSLDLGAGRKGEIGHGWASDFERILEMDVRPATLETAETTQDIEMTGTVATKKEVDNIPISHMLLRSFELLLSQPKGQLPLPNTVSIVRITLTGRGVANQCARVYRIPAPSLADSIETASSIPPATTGKEWLALIPSKKTKPKPKGKPGQKHSRIPLNVPLSKRVRLMAQSLLQPPPPTPLQNREEEDGYPLVPGEEDLIGFVTTGSFNLVEGRGVAIGSVVVRRVLEGVRGSGTGKEKERRLCVVRNAGERLGRLARWEPV